MNKLEPVHENAIDLLVAGMKQIEVAKELGVNPRTVRRWTDSELFIKELEKAHVQARKLHQDELALFNAERLATQRTAMSQIHAALKDPNTPFEMRALCLKLTMQDIQASQRQQTAQAWREKVHAEKRADHLAKEERQREDHLKTISAIKKMDDCMQYLERTNVVPPIEGDDDDEQDKSGQAPCGPNGPTGDVHEKADKTGHLPTSGAVIAKAAKSGHSPMKTPPVVQPVKPFRYPPVVKKADTTGQPKKKETASAL